MATVEELTPGDRVALDGISAVFVAQTDHPLYAGMRLVIWKLDRDATWSHDALSAFQSIGDIVPGEDRQANLRAALHGKGSL